MGGPPESRRAHSDETHPLRDAAAARCGLLVSVRMRGARSSTGLDDPAFRVFKDYASSQVSDALSALDPKDETNGNSCNVLEVVA